MAKIVCADCGGELEDSREAFFRDCNNKDVCVFCVAFRVMTACSCSSCGSAKNINALLLVDVGGRLVPLPVCAACLVSQVQLGETKIVETVGGAVVPDGGLVS